MSDDDLFAEFKSTPGKKHELLSNEQQVADLQELQNLEAVLNFQPGGQDGETLVFVSNPNLLPALPAIFRI
ncbi:MAG: hypothetical protein K2X27_23270 [Candidatus Obscuribacterales bacterium]|nr:hypothetical protein [Candidatus Obscuribacterales bacterium]